MSKYILIRVDDRYAKITDVVRAVKETLQYTMPLYDCTGEDLYYGFETCAENLNNVTMIAIGVKDDEE